MADVSFDDPAIAHRCGELKTYGYFKDELQQAANDIGAMQHDIFGPTGIAITDDQGNAAFFMRAPVNDAGLSPKEQFIQAVSTSWCILFLFGFPDYLKKLGEQQEKGQASFVEGSQ